MTAKTDHTTKKGAKALTNRISEFWAYRGQHVSFQLIDEGFVPAMRGSRVDIRSDMLNGWPRDYALKVLASRGKRAA